MEVQGEKIRDLDSNLEEHRMKLNATEELLQQVCCFIYLMSSNKIAQHLSHIVVGVVSIKGIHFQEN